VAGYCLGSLNSHTFAGFLFYFILFIFFFVVIWRVIVIVVTFTLEKIFVRW